ncbi:MAG: Gfo/Idh/MocA family oxidoreductase [Spirochaetaceae bacterium]|jgi:predicted dehydrogenase|nr:Gfo/Idh/MocA family oxidoreductase [Spirochaetaceae bacterium]
MTHNMAIIGYGGMAGYHHDLIQKHFSQNLQISGVYDVREEAGKKAQERGLKVYGSAEQIYADKEVELVLVATPNDVHKSYSIACLQAGKHVICEKPVTLNSGELEEIIGYAKRSGRFFTVHQNRRWDTDFLILKKIFESGMLHDPYMIESRVQGSQRALHGWRGWKQNGGGMVLDWGIHLIDQMLNFCPCKVVSVNAVLHQVFSKEVDDNFTASFRFENGLHYLVNIAMNSFIVQPRWHISAEDGTALIENWNCDGRIVKLADAKTLEWAEDIVYTAAGPTRSMAPRPKETTLELELPKAVSDGLDYYRNISDALDGKASPIVKPEESLRVMKLIDLVFLSDKEKHGIACAI